jgi:hypothetical protein
VPLVTALTVKVVPEIAPVTIAGEAVELITVEVTVWESLTV